MPNSEHLPANVVPILEATSKSPLVAAGTPLELWRAANHRTWVASFTELGIALFNSDLDESTLPHGYALVAYLFDWETQCQFDGWDALDNRSNTLHRVIAGYEEVGLSGEARALARAFSAWNESGGDHTATSEAYDEVSHEYTVDLDRLDFLACYFVDHADRLFYAGGTT
ncbi:hypothetical protein AAFF27_21365 [Xylophilus sp. GW821-FHT01B05]